MCWLSLFVTFAPFGVISKVWILWGIEDDFNLCFFAGSLTSNHLLSSCPFFSDFILLSMILTFSRFLIQNLSMQIFSKSYGHFSFIKIGFTLLLENNISFVWYHLTEDHDLLFYTVNKENHLGQKVTQGKWLTIIRIFIYLLIFRHWAFAQMTPPSLVRTR